ncbi:MAG TPA: hypothetical protein ENI08_02715 [Candidatus Dependentiae bacterium]|nr:hypothetical protein [Candidatus Dependentiae bacterium]
MNINVTMVIQAINFFIAYWVMRIFLFKPALQVIQGEQIEQTRLDTIIRQQEQSITIKEDERQKHWQACRDYFRDNKPFIDLTKLVVKEMPEVSIPVVRQELIDKLADETQQVLIQKIGYIGG